MAPTGLKITHEEALRRVESLYGHNIALSLPFPANMARQFPDRYEIPLLMGIDACTRDCYGDGIMWIEEARRRVFSGDMPNKGEVLSQIDEDLALAKRLAGTGCMPRPVLPSFLNAAS